MFLWQRLLHDLKTSITHLHSAVTCWESWKSTLKLFSYKSTHFLFTCLCECVYVWGNQRRFRQWTERWRGGLWGGTGHKYNSLKHLEIHIMECNHITCTSTFICNFQTIFVHKSRQILPPGGGKADNLHSVEIESLNEMFTTREQCVTSWCINDVLGYVCFLSSSNCFSYSLWSPIYIKDPSVKIFHCKRFNWKRSIN